MIGDYEIGSHDLEVHRVSDITSPVIRPTKATITLDEGWSPYGQVALQFPIRQALDFSEIDPSATTYFDLTLSSTTNTGVVQQREFSGMMLRSRPLDAKSATASLTLATLDAKLHDHAHISDAVPELSPPSTATTVRKVVDWVLSFIGETIDTANVGVAAGEGFDPTKNPWRTGTTAWSYISPIVQRANLRLWCDEQRVWHLRETSPTPAAQGAFSDSKTMTELTDNISLDETVYDGVVVTYEWIDSTGATQKAYDAETRPGTSRLPFTVTYQRPYPGPGAAARILAALIKRRRMVKISAISDYQVQPGMVATIESPYAPILTGVVESVQWTYPDDEMTIQFRDVENEA